MSVNRKFLENENHRAASDFGTPHFDEPDMKIKYVALPSSGSVMERAEQKPGKTDKGREYRELVIRIQRAQNRMAWIATEFFRPEVFERLDGERRAAIQVANREAEKQAMAHFEEVCTKDY